MNLLRTHGKRGPGLLLLCPGLVVGGGFTLDQQAGSASGRGGAWVAGADDAAANWYNPANLAWLEEPQFQFGLTAVFAGDGTEFTSSDPEFFLTQERTFDAEGHVVTPVHFYYAGRLTDRVAWGLGVNSPFGLVSEWNDLPVTLLARESRLVTFIVNPNLAFRIDDNWSLAIGLDYLYADVQDFSADVPAPMDPTNPTLMVAGQRDLTGDGNDWGWNFAVSYRGEGFRAAFTYRSELEPEIEGNLRFSDSLKPPFMDSPARADLNLPAQAIVGGEWDLTDEWTFEADLVWTDWSTFQALEIDVQNELPPLITDIRLRQDWEDTLSYRVGATWRQNDRHQWRVGAFWNESPAPSDTLRPSIPDSERWAISVGYGYTADRWGLDLYYLPLIFTDNDARGAAAEGVIDGTYSSYGHVAGITVSWMP